MWASWRYIPRVKHSAKVRIILDSNKCFDTFVVKYDFFANKRETYLCDFPSIVPLHRSYYNLYE